MTKLIDALSVRTHFGAIMDQVEEDQTRILVSKRGKPKVIILSVEDYLKNVIKQPKMLTTIQTSAQRAGLDQLEDVGIEAEIADFRNSKKR